MTNDVITETALNYFGLSEQHSSLENSKAVIIPIPYDSGTKCSEGKKSGPAAVLAASQQVELFDEELWTSPYSVGIHSMPAIHLSAAVRASVAPFQKLQDAVAPLLEAEKFPIILGGDRALSLGAVDACLEKFPDLSVLHIGAHTDLRAEYEGNPYSHAAANYQIYQALKQPLITSVGIRNISEEEVTWLENEAPEINIYWDRQQGRWNLQEIVDTLSDNVYLTIVADGLDPAIMPATESPEPGGLSWQTLIELVKVLCVRKNVVAADIVELAPIPNLYAPNFLAAKLLYKLIGYKFALDLGVTKKY